jgi:hypothetical protein
MRALAAGDIVQIWETARRCHPVDQALAFLKAAQPECSRDELRALPLGERDRRLLCLRELSFGDRLEGGCECPHCGAAAEFDLACSALRCGTHESEERAVRVGDYTLRVRPLDSFDMAAAAGAADVAAARRILLDRCVIEAQRGGAVVDAGALPESASAAIAEAALAADPMAELLLELACPACGHRWQAALDIAHILWEEVNARAQRLLFEVHVLARAYGWREADILGMSAARRAAYLQRATA